MRNNNGPSTVPWGTPPLVADQSDVTRQSLTLWDSSSEEVDQPIHDGFINAKLTHFFNEHFVVYPVKCFAKVKQKNAEGFPITIDVGVPAVEHTDEGIDGGITFLWPELFWVKNMSTYVSV